MAEGDGVSGSWKVMVVKQKTMTMTMTMKIQMLKMLRMIILTLMMLTMLTMMTMKMAGVACQPINQAIIQVIDLSLPLLSPSQWDILSGIMKTMFNDDESLDDFLILIINRDDDYLNDHNDHSEDQNYQWL